MPPINTKWRLAAFIASLFLIIINVIPYYRADIAMYIAGNETINNVVTPSVNWITQWAVVMTIIVVFGLFIAGIISYVRNRKKPDTPSSEVQALKELIKEVQGLRKDITNGQSGQSKTTEPNEQKQ